jgi:hypothetical protein
VEEQAIKVAAKVKHDLGQAARASGGPGLVPGWRWAEIARESAAEQQKVLEQINVQQVVVEETAPKKAKVSKFDSVDMELEALAYRIDSMDSGCEDTSWRRSGWRR